MNQCAASLFPDFGLLGCAKYAFAKLHFEATTVDDEEGPVVPRLPTGNLVGGVVGGLGAYAHYVARAHTDPEI
jgi:hypothetical protein